MLARRTNELLIEAGKLLTVFGFDKHDYEKHEELYHMLPQLIPTYDSMVEFLDQYRALIHVTKDGVGIEDAIKLYKQDMHDYFYNPEAQRHAAYLAGAATDLYFLRTAIRSWRRECIEINNRSKVA